MNVGRKGDELFFAPLHPSCRLSHLIFPARVPIFFSHCFLRPLDNYRMLQLLFVLGDMTPSLLKASLKMKEYSSCGVEWICDLT